MKRLVVIFLCFLQVSSLGSAPSLSGAMDALTRLKEQVRILDQDLRLSRENLTKAEQTADDLQSRLTTLSGELTEASAESRRLTSLLQSSRLSFSDLLPWILGSFSAGVGLALVFRL